MLRKYLVAGAASAAMLAAATPAVANDNEAPAPLPALTAEQIIKAGAPDAARPTTLNGVEVPSGGVKIGNTIVYTAGTSGITVPETAKDGTVTPLAASDCPSAATCLFEHNNFTGRYWWGTGYNVNYNLVAYNFNDLASSWINRRSGHSRAFKHGIDTTPSLVLNSGSSTSLAAAWNDEISSIRVGTN